MLGEIIDGEGLSTYTMALRPPLSVLLTLTRRQIFARFGVRPAYSRRATAEYEPALANLGTTDSDFQEQLGGILYHSFITRAPRVLFNLFTTAVVSITANCSVLHTQRVEIFGGCLKYPRVI